MSKKPVDGKIITFYLGIHRVYVNLYKDTDEKEFHVWNVRQAQYVNDSWTTAGCHWYSDKKLADFGEMAEKYVNSGDKKIMEVDAAIAEETLHAFIEDWYGESFLFFEQTEE